MARARWRSTGRGVAAAALLAASIAAFSRGADDVENPEDAAPQPSSSTPVEEHESRPQRVIVLSTGRVVLGDVVERPGGYLVREQFGSVVVPFAQVRLTAADLPDAYHKLSRSMTAPTAGKHLSLAEWCFENRLYDAAQIEVKQALLLEPDRKEAREFLRKLQRTMELGVHADRTATGRPDLDVPQDLASPGQPWKSQARRQQIVRPTENATSVAGLSPETVEMFVVSVQPLIMNKCGNARCHGEAATNEFRMTPVRRGMSGFRVFTEKNLSSVLRHVNMKEPEDSPLLQVLQGPHGDTPRPLFIGPSAEQQQASLREWVLRAAAEGGKRELAQGAAPTSNLDTESLTRPTPRRDPFLEQILAEDRPDVFDPNVFNRLVHENNSRSQPPD